VQAVCRPAWAVCGPAWVRSRVQAACGDLL